MKDRNTRLMWFAFGAISAVLIFSALVNCGKKEMVQRGGTAEAAIASYVPPGDTDPYYRDPGLTETSARCPMHCKVPNRLGGCAGGFACWRLPSAHCTQPLPYVASP